MIGKVNRRERTNRAKKENSVEQVDLNTNTELFNHIFL